MIIALADDGHVNNLGDDNDDNTDEQDWDK